MRRLLQWLRGLRPPVRRDEREERQRLRERGVGVVTAANSVQDALAEARRRPQEAQRLLRRADELSHGVNARVEEVKVAIGRRESEFRLEEMRRLAEGFPARHRQRAFRLLIARDAALQKAVSKLSVPTPLDAEIAALQVALLNADPEEKGELRKRLDALEARRAKATESLLTAAMGIYDRELDRLRDA